LHVVLSSFAGSSAPLGVQHEDEITTADVTVWTSGPDVTSNAFGMSRAMSISPCVDARVEA
jgi:hypothetical protein